MSWRRSRRRQRLQDGLGIALLALTLCILLGGVGLGYAMRAPALDPENLCRLNVAPAGATLVLVETTDALAPRHRRRLRGVVEEEARRLPVGGRMLVLGVKPNAPRELKVLFSRCNPGDAAAANPLFVNTARAQARWEEHFLSPLTAAASKAAAGRKAAKASPIVEAVRSAALEPDFAAIRRSRRLVLVSDLLEHDPEHGFSAYADGASLARWSAAEGGIEPPDLSGIAVRVVALDRADQAQRQIAVRDALWTPLFDAANVSDLQYEGL